MTFTLPLTSWFSDGQLCRRASGVTEPEQKGGEGPLKQHNLGHFFIMDNIRAGAHTETLDKASVGHAAFPTLLEGLVLQPVGAMRYHSFPENISGNVLLREGREK